MNWSHGFKIVQGKIQRQVPWEFLGQIIWESKITSQYKFGEMS